VPPCLVCVVDVAKSESEASLCSLILDLLCSLFVWHNGLGSVPEAQKFSQLIVGY
jgi:hypothetical protein